MAKPIIHARSSANKFGGEPEDYLEIHDLMDSSKAAFPDNRHRALTHNNWFFFVVERIFGHEIDLTCTSCGHKGRFNQTSPGRSGTCWQCGHKQMAVASTRDVCEQHVMEDFGNKYIPTVSDYFEGMDFQPWMNNGLGDPPTSHRKLAKEGHTTRRRAITLD
jgi:hypothetical protein